MAEISPIMGKWEIESNDNGSNHPGMKLPTVPPSLEESILYGPNISMFLRLPTKLYPGGCKEVRFFNKLNRKNKCSAKLASKMLCVLMSRKNDRENLLAIINKQSEVWDNQTILDPMKILNIFCHPTNNTQLRVKAIDHDVFDNMSASVKLDGIFLLWVDVSLQVLMEKNLHMDWIEQLKHRYLELVGATFDCMNDATIATCILWIPSVTVFYLPFSRQAAKVTNENYEESRKRIWKSISNSSWEDISLLQYNIIPLPDNWLDYNCITNKFLNHSLIKNISGMVEIQYLKKVLKNVNEQKCVGQHYSMVHPSTPFCPNSDIKQSAFRSSLFFLASFRWHCKQYLSGDIQIMLPEQIVKDNILVIDLDLDDSAWMINVDVMQANGKFDNLHSTLKINRCVVEQNLLHGKAFGEVVAAKSNSGIRKMDGNHGHLHTFEMHEHNSLFKTFSDTQGLRQDMVLYKNFVDTLMDMAEKYFPVELAVMIQSKYSWGITSYLVDHPCHNLISNREGPCSISTSINFATPQHVDVRDGSTSIFGWFHIGYPISTGYFLMGNIKVKVKGHIYTGLAIKLVDGLIISGDGQMICHGTTASFFDGSLFGIQFAANVVSMGSKM